MKLCIHDLSKKIILFVLLCGSMFACKGTDEEPEKPEEAVPALIATIPIAGATISVQTETIRFIFDRNIIVADKAKMKLNGQVVQKAAVSEDTLILTIGQLEEKTNYILTLETKAIKAQPGTFNPEPFSLTFTTDALPPLPPQEFDPLVVKNPTPETVTLYNYLRDCYGKKILSGTVARVDWNTVEADRVGRWTGKLPKLNVFDYIFLYASPAPGWIDYGNTTVVENWHQAGGIVGAMWHWNVPKSETSAANDVSFRPKEDAFPEGTTFSPAKALIEGTWENTVMKADLQKVADYLLLLKSKNIPVIWRPLHEAAGNTYATGYQGSAWFWWGRDGAEAFKGLWIYMFNYFQQRGLNNLIWVWTTEVNDPPFYPGDEYVDMIGRDLYNNTNATAIAAQFTLLQQRYPNKMITLAECGNVANIGEQWEAGARWAWFMPWYDYNATDSDNPPHEHAGKAWWQAAMKNANVISRD
ncbi:MAG: beta-mannosidase [Dysgonamonadaceae bacterium]|jgi:mannan endo-1,4-beta-mannosidase|nr:beta-mannosidase [Dysgonamonadaceae bacterium]